LDRIRNQVFNWGEPGLVDQDYLDLFTQAINDDLNMPRALAVMWDLAKSELPPSVKKATVLEFDSVLGLGLGRWKPIEEEIPADIQKMLEARQIARNEKRWQDADELRDKITGAGYELEDTPQGPRVKKKKILVKE